MRISVAQEFSPTPGPRYREEGDFSGEEFLEKLLKPKYDEAVAAREILEVDLDGAEGYATSFLEAAFGGLAKMYGVDEVLKNIQLRCEDEPYLVLEIQKYIKEAHRE